MASSSFSKGLLGGSGGTFSNPIEMQNWLRHCHQCGKDADICFLHNQCNMVYCYPCSKENFVMGHVDHSGFRLDLAPMDSRMRVDSMVDPMMDPMDPMVANVDFRESETYYCCCGDEVTSKKNGGGGGKRKKITATAASRWTDNFRCTLGMRHTLFGPSSIPKFVKCACGRRVPKEEWRRHMGNCLAPQMCPINLHDRVTTSSSSSSRCKVNFSGLNLLESYCKCHIRFREAMLQHMRNNRCIFFKPCSNSHCPDIVFDHTTTNVPRSWIDYHNERHIIRSCQSICVLAEVFTQIVSNGKNSFSMDEETLESLKSFFSQITNGQLNRIPERYFRENRAELTRVRGIINGIIASN